MGESKLLDHVSAQRPNKQETRTAATSAKTQTSCDNERKDATWGALVVMEVGHRNLWRFLPELGVPLVRKNRAVELPILFDLKNANAPDGGLDLL